MLFLLGPNLCFIIDFICDLFVARNVFTTFDAEGEGWDPVKLV